MVLATGVFAQTDQIGGRRWKLVQINGSNVGTSAAYFELSADRTRFSGNAGCNRIFGSVDIRRDTINFSKVGITRMACANRRVQKLETEFVRALENADRYERRGASLTLFVRRRAVMKLEAPGKQNSETPADTARIEDKKWALEAIAGAPVSKIGQSAFLVFDRDKQSAGGNSSCNVFGGTYSLSGNALKITDVVSTMRACIEDNRMKIERQFLDSLAKTNRYEIHAGKLNLYQGKRLLLTFKGVSK
jgi:heat shock protein HslJ